MTTDLMKNKKGLIMGVANDHSIAWGIAQTLYNNGANLAFTYQGDTFKKRIEPLAKKINCDKYLINCDVLNQDELENAFNIIKDDWGSIDFIVHSLSLIHI